MSLAQTRRPAINQLAPEEVTPGGAQDTQQANVNAATGMDPPAGAISRPTIGCATSILHTSGGPNFAGRQYSGDSQSDAAAGDQTADRQGRPDAQVIPAVGVNPGPGRPALHAPVPKVASLFDPALALAADVVDDLERVRVANENRLRQLTRSIEDADGEVRGFGLDESHPDVARLGTMVETLRRVEHEAVLNLQRHMRRHPLAPWAKGVRGAGEKQVARLLAAIGDPYLRPEVVRADGSVSPAGPRTVSALWAYLGLHVLPFGSQYNRVALGLAAAEGGSGPAAGVAPRLARGQKANWSTHAKTRAYLIALSCLKQLVKPCHNPADGPAVHLDGCDCSPYRVVYDRRRAHTSATRPDWTDGHFHNDALRVSAKAFLRDLWRESKRIHESSEEP